MANKGNDFFAVDLLVTGLQGKYGGGVFRFTFRCNVLLKDTKNRDVNNLEDNLSIFLERYNLEALLGYLAWIYLKMVLTVDI